MFLCQTLVELIYLISIMLNNNFGNSALKFRSFLPQQKKMLRWLDNIKSCLCTSSALVLPRLVGASALTLATSAKMSMRSKLLTNQRITFTLTFFMAMFPLYRNQSIDLQYKSRREWLSGFRHCDRIGRFPVQTPLAAQLALGT